MTRVVLDVPELAVNVEHLLQAGTVELLVGGVIHVPCTVTGTLEESPDGRSPLYNIFPLDDLNDLEAG